MMNQLHELEDALVKQILIAADSRKDSLKKKKILKTARKLWTLILDPESESKLSLYWGPFPITFFTAQKHSTGCLCAAESSFNVQSWCEPGLQYCTLLLRPLCHP